MSQIICDLVMIACSIVIICCLIADIKRMDAMDGEIKDLKRRMWSAERRLGSMDYKLWLSGYERKQREDMEDDDGR